MTYLLDTNAVSDLMRAEARIENWLSELHEDDRVVNQAAGDRDDRFGDEASEAPVISTARLRRAMREIAAKKGDFTLFGLVMRADAPGTWDLVVSASWLVEGKLKALREFAALLAASNGDGEDAIIMRAKRAA